MIGQGGSFPEWADLDESLQAGFGAAARYLQDLFSGEPDEGGSWRTTAANCYLQFCRDASETALEFEQIPTDTLRAWEAFARHASNMMDFDAADDKGGLESHETYWTQWAADKKAAAGMTQQQADAQRPFEEDY